MDHGVELSLNIITGNGGTDSRNNCGWLNTFSGENWLTDCISRLSGILRLRCYMPGKTFYIKTRLHGRDATRVGSP